MPHFGEVLRGGQHRKLQFLKLNCEGAEFPILLASPADVLRRVRMLLVLYHYDLWAKNPKEDLVSHLQTNGFERKIRNFTETRGWIVASNPAEPA